MGRGGGGRRGARRDSGANRGNGGEVEEGAEGIEGVERGIFGLQFRRGERGGGGRSFEGEASAGK